MNKRLLTYYGQMTEQPESFMYGQDVKRRLEAAGINYKVRSQSSDDPNELVIFVNGLDFKRAKQLTETWE